MPFPAGGSGAETMVTNGFCPPDRCPVRRLWRVRRVRAATYNRYSRQEDTAMVAMALSGVVCVVGEAVRRASPVRRCRTVVLRWSHAADVDGEVVAASSEHVDIDDEEGRRRRCLEEMVRGPREEAR